MKRYKAYGNRRIKALIILGTLIPLLTIWIFTSYRLYKLQESNIDSLIKNDLSALDNGLQNYLNSLEYMSLQLITDQETGKGLEVYFLHEGVERTNILTNLVRRISLYQAANPTIGNINYYYVQDENLMGIGNTMLYNQLPDEGDLLFPKKGVRFYGPHRTASMASDYPVISLVRELAIPGSPLLYLYIETGYKQLPVFSSATLDTLNATYAMVSSSGSITYSSNEELLPLRTQAPPLQERLELNGTMHRWYHIQNRNGWGISVFVPVKAYQAHIYELNFSFLLILILIVSLCIVILVSSQNAIYRPLKQFEENLKIILEDDGTAVLKPIHIPEFDDNFQYFQTMKLRIGELIQTTQQLEQVKTKLQMSELLYKINPHFIYNTLTTLESYAHEKNHYDVEHFVNTLNQLLIYNMEHARVTTLQKELQAINQYLELQNLKYDLIIDIKNTLPEPILRTELPCFILQPLVENSIFHGVEGEGYIGIHLALTAQGKISIKILNDGVPLHPQAQKRLNGPAVGRGIGLSYVKRALASFFGEQHQFKAYTTAKGRTVVELILPFSQGGRHA